MCSHLGWTLNLPRGPGSHVDQGLEHSTARDSKIYKCNVYVYDGLFPGDWSTHTCFCRVFLYTYVSIPGTERQDALLPSNEQGQPNEDASAGTAAVTRVRYLLIKDAIIKYVICIILSIVHDIPRVHGCLASVAGIPYHNHSDHYLFMITLLYYTLMCSVSLCNYIATFNISGSEFLEFQDSSSTS